MKNNSIEIIAKQLWGVTLLALIVTSFSYFPAFFGRTISRPLALYPVAILLPLLIYLTWKKKNFSWPSAATPLLIFLLIAAITTLVASLNPPTPLGGQTFFSRSLRAWVSLGIGLAFLLTAYLSILHFPDIRFVLKWIYIALFIQIVWGGIQLIAFQTDLIDMEWVNIVQNHFAMRDVIGKRVSGLAYEPSWMADQILILFLPWLFAAVFTKFHLSRFHWLEPILLFSALGLLFFTYSRGGLINVVFSITVTILILWRGKINIILRWFFSPTNYKKVTNIIPRVLAVGGILISGYLLIQILKSNAYFASLWTVSLENGLSYYFTQTGTGARTAYASSAFNIFSQHPWTGVGLGNNGFYLFQNLPAWALGKVDEISHNLNPFTFVFPNAKNMYFRLLSETGIMGFWSFAAFWLSILASILKIQQSKETTLNFVGSALIFFWFASSFRLFTFDSFTFSIFWITIGITLGFTKQLKDNY